MPNQERFHSPEEFPVFALGHTAYDFVYLEILCKCSGVQALRAWISSRVLTNYTYFYFWFSRRKALQTMQVTSFNGVGMVSQAVRLWPVIYFAVTVFLD